MFIERGIHIYIYMYIERERDVYMYVSSRSGGYCIVFGGGERMNWAPSSVLEASPIILIVKVGVNDNGNSMHK